MNADQVKELLSKATPGPWQLWTSCSWRRFRNADHQVVCEPTVASYDGHPDLSMSEGTAALIAAAPDIAALAIAQAAEIERLRGALEQLACAWTIRANSLYVNGGTEFDAGKAAGLAQASESLTRTYAALEARS